MKRRSWIILIVCLLIVGGLYGGYVLTQGGPERLTQEQAIEMTRQMERDFSHKNANAILEFVSPAPDTRVANISQDQFHVLLVRYFRSSDRVGAEMSNYAFSGGDTDATLAFDVAIHNDGMDSRKIDYSGRVTLRLKRVEAPHLFGLYQTKEWRIVGADATSLDLSGFGD